MQYIYTVNNQWEIDDYLRMMESNATCFRINGAHITSKALLLLKKVKNMRPNNITIYFDLPGAKTRLWNLKYKKSKVSTGEVLKIKTNKSGTEGFGLTGSDGLHEMCINDILFVRRTGKTPIELQVKDIQNGYILAEVKIGGDIGQGYHIYNKNKYFPVEKLYDSDYEAFEKIEYIQPDVIGISFADTPKVVCEVKQLTQKIKKNILVYAKIESGYALSQLDLLGQASDGFIVGRDDLSANFTESEIQDIVLQVVACGNRYGLPVISASNYFQYIYDNKRMDARDRHDFEVLYSRNVQGIYVNETNKDRIWEKYVSAAAAIESYYCQIQK